MLSIPMRCKKRNVDLHAEYAETNILKLQNSTCLARDLKILRKRIHIALSFVVHV